MAMTASHSNDWKAPRPDDPAVPAPEASSPPAAPARNAEAQNTSTRAVVTDAPRLVSALGESATASSKRPRRPCWILRTRTAASAATPTATKKYTLSETPPGRGARRLDRKSTRLNSSHVASSYAVLCVKKKTPVRSKL